MLLAGSFLLASGSASATPYGCSASVDAGEDTGVSQCAGGTGQHRVVIHCRPAGANYFNTWYGDWVDAGQVSTESCFPWETIVGATYQLTA